MLIKKNNPTYFPWLQKEIITGDGKWDKKKEKEKEMIEM